MAEVTSADRRIPEVRRTEIEDRAVTGPRSASRGRIYGAIGGAALVLAGVSLLYPSTPNYDPWAWLIWGREIIHLNLVTDGGPTWKPLAMIFTTAFAPFGSAAPDMWLVVARAGGIAALGMAFALAFRLTQMGLGSMHAPCWGAGHVASPLSALPPLLAGLAAAVGVLALSQFAYDVALGYSEGLLLAATLLAVLRHLDGAPRQAFAFAFIGSLDRPELWPFLCLYAAYLWRREPTSHRLVASLLAVVIPLWFMPDLIGSGSLLRGVQYALYPRAAARAPCPICTEITHNAWPLVIAPFKLGVGLLALAVAGRFAMSLRTGARACRAVREAVRSHDVSLGVLALGFAMFVEDAALTELGSSGNDRYLFPAAALLIVVAAAQWAVASRWLAGRLARLAGPAGGIGAIVASGAIFVAVSPTHGAGLIRVAPTLRRLHYQAQQRVDLPRAIRAAGGTRAIRACGPVATNPATAPLLAWTLHMGIGQLQSLTGHVLVRARQYAAAPIEPSVPAHHHYRLIANVRTVQIFSNC